LYIKVSIQFVCAGNSGISQVLCNTNTYRSIHEGLFFNSSPALDLKIPLETPLYPFLFLFALYGPTSPLLRSELSAAELSGIPLKYKSQSDWLKYL
jgi:hypothetical protein